MCVAAAIAGAGLAGVAGSAISASTNANAATKAAQTQANAANNASNNELAMFGQVRQSLTPYINAGGQGISDLQSALPGLTTPMNPTFAPTQQQLEQTPGYQFQLNQGLQATQNGYASQGLGVSGAALKGAANYSEGLAGTTWQQQAQNYYQGFNNYLGQNQQIYNQLSGLASLGENAAAGVGNAGLSAQNQANALQTSGAAATAAGQVGSANALSSAISSGTSTAGNAGLLLALNNNGLFGGGGGASSPVDMNPAGDPNT